MGIEQFLIVGLIARLQAILQRSALGLLLAEPIDCGGSGVFSLLLMVSVLQGQRLLVAVCLPDPGGTAAQGKPQ